MDVFTLEYVPAKYIYEKVALKLLLLSRPTQCINDNIRFIKLFNSAYHYSVSITRRAYAHLSSIYLSKVFIFPALCT